MTDPANSDAADSAPADSDPATTDLTSNEVAETLAYIRLTLEIIAFLLAVLVFQSGGIGVLVGSIAILVLLWNASSL